MRYVVTFLLSVGLAMAQWGITPNPGQPIPKAPLPGSISTGQCLYNNNGVWGGTACSGGSGAPTVGTYIIQITNASLPDAQVLASLATGIVKNTTTTGVLSIAAAGTDYQAPLTCATTGGLVFWNSTTFPCSADFTYTAASHLLAGGTNALINIGPTATTTFGTATVQANGLNWLYSTNPGANHATVWGAVQDNTTLTTATPYIGGVIGTAEVTGTGNSTTKEMMGLAGWCNHTGTATSLYCFGIDAEGFISAGTESILSGVYAQTTISGGTVANNYTVYIAAPAKSGGTVTTNIGLEIANQGSVGTNNYAINTGTGIVSFQSATSLLVPSAASLTAAAAGAFGEDSTATMYHTFTGGVDSLVVTVPTATSITNGNCAQWIVSGSLKTLGQASGACGAGGGGAFQANGTPLTSTSTINFENSAATDGITLTFANPSAGNVQLGFTGTLSLAGGGTGATSQANAAIAVLPTATRAGDVIYWDGSIWNHLAGNNSGTNFLQETSSGVPSWAASTASTVWQLAGSTVVTGNTFNANFGLTLTNVGGVATTGVNTAVIPSHALLQAGGDVACSPSGGVTAYTCNFAVALTAYTKQMFFSIVPDVSTTTSATLAINGLSTVSIKQIDGTTDPGANLVAGQPYWLEYDGTVFRIMGAVGGGSMVYPSGTGFAIVTGGASWGTTLADPLPVGHGGTGAATAANALIALFPAATRAGDIIYCATYSSGCTSWGLLAGNNSGTNFLQENSAGAPSWNAGSSTVSLSAITAASGANSINNVDNQQAWYWAKTSNNSKGLFISENTAATGGTFTNQQLVQITTIAGSTAIPLGVSNSLTGTQALPTASFAAAWNTSGQAIGLTFNATITGSCTTCLLESLAVGGVRQWTTDVSGNVIQLGNLTMGTDGTTAATVQMANGSAAFHTILGSAATANNTVKFFATAPVTGDLVSCVTSSTTCTFTDSGVLAANVVAVSASGAGTIAYYNGSAWTTLAGNASGTKVLQETSSGVPSWASAAGGGTGNAGNEVSVSFSATPTYTCGSATAGTVTIFEVGILTGNITGSTLATCGAAQLIAFQFQQASSGGPYTVTMPSGFDALTISPTASIYTTALYWYDGTTGRLQSVSTTDTPGFIFMPERSAPGTPPSGDCAIWSDSTDHTGPEAKCNNSANVFTLVPRNTGTANQTLLSSATGGSYSWGVITSAYVNNTIALTGTDINTSNQVTVTHLAAALPVNQGGSGALTFTTHGLLLGEGTGAFGVTAAGGANFPLIGQASADPIFSTIAYPTSLATGAALYASSTTAIAGSITPTLGVAGTSTGTWTFANATGAGTFTIGASPSTTTNTILGPTAVPTTGHILSCTTSSTTCTLTDSGVVAANVVNASSPGIGIAHFAGSTQTATSSLIVAADITSNTITGTQLASSLALVTPNIGAATGTSLLATGIVDGEAPITLTTGSSASLGGTYNSGYTYNQEGTAATAIVYTLPTAAAGKQYCIGNSYNGSAGTTGTLKLLTSASGQFIIYNGALSATNGYVISAGALGDKGCAVGIDSTHWEFYAQVGTWTLH